MMTFRALLTKELRLRLRSERTVWVLVVYVILMGLLGWLVVQSNSNSTSTVAPGLLVYIFLSLLQTFLIVFTAPAYTATAINGEKERQTFDLLLCSRLTGFSLVLGKLTAGLINSLLLIAVVIPVFSMVFFFGGISLLDFLGAITVYFATALLVSALGLFFSTFTRRPALSTVVTYIICMIWISFPLWALFVWYAVTHQPPSSEQFRFLSIWNPFGAIISTYPGVLTNSFWSSVWPIPSWLVYVLVNLCVTMLLVLWSASAVRPRLYGRGAQRNVPKSSPEQVVA